MGALRLFLHYAGKVISLDEWQESKHPRDPEGKFATSGSSGGGSGGASSSSGSSAAPATVQGAGAGVASGVVNSHIVKLLTGKGFKKVKGTAWEYQHANGNKVIFHPPEVGKKSTSKWQHELGGEKVRGFGLALEKVLGELGDAPKPLKVDFGELPDEKPSHESLIEAYAKALKNYHENPIKSSAKAAPVTEAYKAATEAGVKVEQLTEAWNSVMGKSGKLAETPPKSSAISTAPQAHAPIKLGELKKTGEKLGSNPGGTYTDAQGNKFYVKTAQSPSHAANENLAASLYQLAGVKTLTYRKAEDNPSAVVTEWQHLDKDNVNKLSSDELKKAQEDFAVHAWLANWDVVGIDGKNLVATGGAPIAADFGGSLLYRAQGKPKGAAFGNAATEWESLRNGTNPQTAAVFGSMTAEQLKASAKKLEAISDADVAKLVEQAEGLTPAQKVELKGKLALRRADILKKAAAAGEAEAAAAKAKADAEAAAKAEQENYKKHQKTHAELRAVAPQKTPSENSALSNYKGSGYQSINGALRNHQTNSDAEHIKSWLKKADFPEDKVLYRGVKGQYAQIISSVADVGARIAEKGVMSMSTSNSFSKGWAGKGHSGALFMEITVPKGSKAAAPYDSDGEYEVLAHPSSHLEVTHWDPVKGRLKAVLRQEHLKL